MHLHGRIKVGSIGNGLEAPAPADVVCKLPAQPDGSLLVADEFNGAVYRVTYGSGKTAHK